MTIRFDPDGVYQVLAALDRPCYVVRAGDRIGATDTAPGNGAVPLAAVGPLPPERLGSPEFGRHHGVRYPYQAGSMAGGIASERLVVALARAGYLASFGAVPDWPRTGSNGRSARWPPNCRTGRTRPT